MFKRTVAMAKSASGASTPRSPSTPYQFDTNAFTRALKSHSSWRAEQARRDPAFFPSLAKGQTPKILWIGCSDSRIPAEQILGLKPGEVFVHRNIANVLFPTDLSSLSVIEYAVAHLGVEHAVVCGHTGCGGVNAALGQKKLGVLDLWLSPLRQLRLKHAEELEKCQDQARRLSELNVSHSLAVLRTNPTVIDAVMKNKLQLHGLMYDLEHGKLEVLEGGEEAEERKTFDVFAVE